MIVIITTDVLKVLLAKVIRKKLLFVAEGLSDDNTPLNYIDIFSKVAGVVLFIFGIVLLLRVGVF